MFLDGKLSQNAGKGLPEVNAWPKVDAEVSDRRQKRDTKEMEKQREVDSHSNRAKRSLNLPREALIN
jgi:hypothetical protein